MGGKLADAQTTFPMQKNNHVRRLAEKNGVLAEACRGLAEALQRAWRGLGNVLERLGEDLERAWKGFRSNVPARCGVEL